MDNFTIPYIVFPYLIHNWKTMTIIIYFHNNLLRKRWLSYKSDWSSLAFRVISFSGSTTNNIISLMLTFAGSYHDMILRSKVITYQYLRNSTISFWRLFWIFQWITNKNDMRKSSSYFASNNIWFVIHFRFRLDM